LLAGVFAVLACSKTESPAKLPVELHVYAAASLREACEEIGKLWEVKNPTEELVFNFGASNTLAQQIVASHKADVFLSADTAQLEVVRKAGLVQFVGRPGWLSNQLVVIVPTPRNGVKIEAASDLARPEFAKLSLANPEAPRHLQTLSLGHGANPWGLALDPTGRTLFVVDPRAVDGVPSILGNRLHVLVVGENGHLSENDSARQHLPVEDGASPLWMAVVAA